MVRAVEKLLDSLSQASDKSPSGQRQDHRANEAGQIIVEYVLLLIVAVGIAALLVSLLVSRNPESPGIIITKWQRMIEAISSDSADDIQRQEQGP